MIEFPSDPEAYLLTIPAMGSVIDVRWIPAERPAEKPEENKAPDDPSKIGECLQADIDRWVDVMSDYQQDSQVNRLCLDAQDGHWHSPSSELWRVLMLCDSWHRWSQGAFDASLGALTRLRRSKKIATSEQWEQASRSSGWEYLEWDRNNCRVRFKRPGIRLDFGAIGKGFVVDRLGERLRERGIDRYSVNASGNMVFGESPKPAAQGWPVAIGLVDQPDRSLCSLRLAKCGIATSGDLHQRYRDRPGVDSSDGKLVSSHILDPAKQAGLTGSVMATVITDSATSADAFATACCVHAARGTLRSWLMRLESHDDGYEVDFEIWVQSIAAVGQTPVLIHWA
ncbi:MAG: FAD:protein FMN transferase [Planctomycetota bacterium]